MRRLRGIKVTVIKKFCQNDYTNLLIDASTQSPYNIGSWEAQLYGNTDLQTLYNETFVYEKYPLRPFQIKGLATMTFEYCLISEYNQGHFVGYFYLEKILPNDTAVVISAFNVSENQSTGETFTQNVCFYFEEPVTIDRDQRIALRIHIESWHLTGYNQKIIHYFESFVLSIPVIYT